MISLEEARARILDSLKPTTAETLSLAEAWNRTLARPVLARLTQPPADVSAKAETSRTAIARGRITMRPETLALIQQGGIGKGDVLGIARVAGIMAAKKTSELIPMCHPLPISKAEVRVEPADGGLSVTARVKTTGQTGVEMEALTACSVACLTLYDMLKAAEKGMVIEAVRLVSKTGGKSGDWSR